MEPLRFNWPKDAVALYHNYDSVYDYGKKRRKESCLAFLIIEKKEIRESFFRNFENIKDLQFNKIKFAMMATNREFRTTNTVGQRGEQNFKIVDIPKEEILNIEFLLRVRGFPSYVFKNRMINKLDKLLKD